VNKQFPNLLAGLAILFLLIGYYLYEKRQTQLREKTMVARIHKEMEKRRAAAEKLPPQNN
jgi:CRISPR/Cas system-associated exonuclease Cas4 (RecB family)